MTTVENATMDLINAVEMADVKGIITREGTDVNYTVGKDSDGEWTIAADHSPEYPSTLNGYMTDNWRVVSYGYEAPDETVMEFFGNLNMWTFVQSHGGHTQFIFTGTDWDENGREVVKLVHSRYLNDVVLEGDTLGATNAYEVVKNDDETPRVADQLVRMLIRQLRSERAGGENALNRLNDVQERLSKVTQDFHTVNRKINEYAYNQGMCSDYERRIFGWNTDLVEMTLTGRPDRNFTFHVPVRVPALGEDTLYVTVDGASTGIRNPREAKEYVSNMSGTQILRSLYDTGFNLEFSTDDTGEEVTY